MIIVKVIAGYNAFRIGTKLGTNMESQYKKLEEKEKFVSLDEI
ncbi:hypothetical protein [Methanosarcina soligelidi]|nr:hypothetical protein [Methanosarcina soligelidi]